MLNALQTHPFSSKTAYVLYIVSLMPKVAQPTKLGQCRASAVRLCYSGLTVKDHLLTQ